VNILERTEDINRKQNRAVEFDDSAAGTSVHNDKLGNLQKVKVFWHQTNEYYTMNRNSDMI